MNITDILLKVVYEIKSKMIMITLLLISKDK